MSIGRKIEIARREKNWSQEEFAKKINVSRNTIYRWEGEHTKPNSDELQKIAQATGKPISFFFEDASARPKVSERALKVLQDHPEFAEALEDPQMVKFLLIAHKNTKEIKDTFNALVEIVPKLSPEKRQAILALCK